MDTVEVKYIITPEWTDTPLKKGLDHLGMKNSCIYHYQKLLPGISNVTKRIRYYGLYAWLSKMYAKNVRDTNPVTWKLYIRRAEALYALIACDTGNERGVSGSAWAADRLKDVQDDIINFAIASDPGSDFKIHVPYLQNAWGAFGQAYGSQLKEIGILTDADQHDIAILTDEIGKGLASAFEQEAGKIGALFYKKIEEGCVSRSELRELSVLVPSGINPSSQERDCYEKILFGDLNDECPNVRSRRLSLSLILEITRHLKKRPTPTEIRWVLFSGYTKSGEEVPFSSPELQAQRSQWLCYHLNDLCHVAFEALLKYLLDRLELYSAGISLDQFIGLCLNDIEEEASFAWPISWHEFLETTGLAENAYSDSDENSEWALAKYLLDKMDQKLEVSCSSQDAWRAIKLMAVIHKRGLEYSTLIANEYGELEQNAFRSVYSEINFFEQHMNNQFRTFLSNVIEQRIIRRHMWVALRKLRYQKDYTFLIEMDDGKIRVRSKDVPTMTNPRLGPAIEFLSDIYFINEQGLTSLGEEMLEMR